jgi:hypothetical protein
MCDRIIREREYENEDRQYCRGNTVFASAKKKEHPPKTEQGRDGEKHVLE